MLDIKSKLNLSVLRNLLLIKGISYVTAKKLCGIVGILPTLKMNELSTRKLDLLNLILSAYKKKTQPFKLNSSTAILKNKINLINSNSNKNDNITQLKNSLLYYPSQEENNNRLLFLNKVNRKYWGLNIIHTPILVSLNNWTLDNIMEKNILINSHKGRRFLAGYPVHGQRTRSNAKTAKRLNKQISRIKN